MNVFEPIYHIYSISTVTIAIGGAVVIVWWLDLQLPVQSVPITNEVVSSNPAHVRCT